MIVGSVDHSFHAWVRVTVLDAEARPHEFDALVDTGFSGFITLPRAVVASLGLRFVDKSSAMLANGVEERFDRHAGTVLWDGLRRPILVEVADTMPLVGVKLLAGCGLRIEMTPKGVVEIDTTGPQLAAAVFGGGE